MAAPDLLRLFVGAALLAYAAVSDWRTREVKDELWAVLGAIALALLALQMWSESVDARVALLFVPTAVLLYDPLVGESFRKEDGGWQLPLRTLGIDLVALAAALYAIGAVASEGDPATVRGLALYLTVPVMMLVFRGMYEVHLLKGGADAKAMIVIAALVPVYPALPPFPLVALDPRLQDAMAVLFPFSFVVLLNAALLFLVVPVALLIYNAGRGHVKLPHALVGYKVPLDRTPKHAWFMDRIEGGKHVVVYFPTKRQDREAILQDLRAAGFTEAWVTPQLPFMVPLAIAYAISFLVGNPLMGLLQLILPRP